jgi:hypothetical protein
MTVPRETPPNHRCYRCGRPGTLMSIIWTRHGGKLWRLRCTNDACVFEFESWADPGTTLRARPTWIVLAPPPAGV